MSTKPDIKRQVAIFEKDGIYSAIGIYSCEGHLHAVCNFAPRQRPENQFYRASLETRELAFERFHESVAQTRDRGWSVVYNAAPNFG
mgnify:CR=1 FL=1